MMLWRLAPYSVGAGAMLPALAAAQLRFASSLSSNITSWEKKCSKETKVG